MKDSKINKQNLKETMKIFITGINTELGYHLVETLRNDHLLLEGYSLISGTLSRQQPFTLHESVHESFDFNKQRDEAVKCAIDSDVLIVDVRNNPSPQIEFIMKVLKHYNRRSQMKVIGISNYMTWSNAKNTQFIKTPHDKEELFDFTVNKQKWITVSLQRQNYPLRSPHPMFVYNYLLEQQIMQLKYHQKLIKPIILCSGVLYGKSGLDLGQQIQNAIQCKKSQLIRIKNNNILTGQQKIPLLNVDRLLQVVKSIVNEDEKSKQISKQQYLVLCQSQPKSIIKIIEELHNICGHVEFLNQRKQTDQQQNNTQSIVAQNQLKTFIPELTFAYNKKLFSFLSNINFSNQSFSLISFQQKHTQNQVIQQSKQPINGQKSIKNTIQQFAHNILDQFTQYHQVTFKHFILSQELGKQFLSNESKTENINYYNQNQTNIINTLLKKYTLLDKNKITSIKEKLIQTGQIPQERLVTPEDEKKKSKTIVQKNQKKQTIKKQPQQIFFPQIIKKFLSQNINSNFIICIQKQLITKMFTLLHQESFSFFKDIKFILLNKKINEPSNQNAQIVSENIEKTIELFQNEFFQVTGLIQLEEKIEDQDKNKQSQPVYEVSQNQKISKKTNSAFNEVAESQQTKVNLLSQYLLDNVIVYLAEAKQKLKQKGILKDGQKFEGKQNIKLFIQELKQIKKRQEQLLENQDDQEKEV